MPPVGVGQENAVGHAPVGALLLSQQEGLAWQVRRGFEQELLTGLHIDQAQRHHVVTGSWPQEEVAAILPHAPDVRVPPVLRIAQHHQRHLAAPILREDVARSQTQNRQQKQQAVHGVNLDHEKGPR